MDFACLKAKTLAYQHLVHVQRFSSTMPNVEGICLQLSQAQASINKIKNSITLLDNILDNLEKTSSPRPSPIRTSFDSSAPPSSTSLTEPPTDDGNSSPVLRATPPRPRRKTNESPYLTARPRGAVSKKQAGEGSPLPPSSPPSASPYELWVNDIIPKWHQLNPREVPWIRAMWRSGIPSNLRGQVWKLAIDNKLNLTPEIYAKLLEELPSTDEQHDVHREIEVDVNRMFAKLDVGDLMEYRKKLTNVLTAYSRLKSDVGYVQGMSYIAGMLLYYMSDFDSFVCMSNLLENKFLQGLFRLNMATIDQYVSIFGSLLAQIEPKLDQHFIDVGLIPQHYLLQWWLPIFSKSLPVDICGRIWDCYFLEGEIYSFVASLGILRLYRKSLKSMDMESCKKLLSNLPSDIPQEDLFMAIESIPAPLYNSFLEKIHGEITDDNETLS